MLTPIGNYHHHAMPRPGAIVIVKMDRQLMSGHRWRRFIVESYPLSDAADQRYSKGMHTVNLRALDNNWRCRVSGFWCEEID
jgi:hypothetical protein